MNTQLFWSRVDARGVCWEWVGGTNGRGYGQMSCDGVVKMAHRISYELLVREIPSGLEPDHLCRNKLCVAPDHLELVTHAENCRRAQQTAKPRRVQTHCRRNHELSEENVYMYKGKRHCRSCRKAAKANV